MPPYGFQYTLYGHGSEAVLTSLTVCKQAVRVATRYAPAPLLPRGATAHRAPPSRRNAAVVSHAQYVLTVTAAPASRVKAAVSKAAW